MNPTHCSFFFFQGLLCFPFIYLFFWHFNSYYFDTIAHLEKFTGRAFLPEPFENEFAYLAPTIPEYFTLLILISFNMIISYQWPVFSRYRCIKNLPTWLHCTVSLSPSEYSKFHIPLPAPSPPRGEISWSLFWFVLQDSWVFLGCLQKEGICGFRLE